MKKILVILMTLVVVVFWSPYCRAGDATDAAVASARTEIVKKTGGLLAGVATGFLFHEAGHQIVAKLENVDMGWSGLLNPRWMAYTDDREKFRRITFGGFGAQVLSTEVILGVDAIPKDNAFILGWLGFNILNTMLYVGGGNGDFKMLRENGVDTTYLGIGLAAYALLSAYRLYKNPAFVPYVQVAKDEFVLGVTWKW
jgi:hypothetical protein